MQLIDRWWKPPSQMNAYFRLLEENFRERYGSTPVEQLPALAKKLMPKLPEDVFGWPMETLHVILGELLFFSEPELLSGAQIIEPALICSNAAQVATQRLLFERNYIQKPPPEVVEHIPEHILRVTDITICKRHSFCPVHPVSDIVWQRSADSRRQSR